ncbi:unnamed protein product [Somion occarium]|uniref:Uncharacterized protein n=1 Tax=Somion occarium TaxID=3059160 RepID=A0ABP1DVU9_9APHY
MSSMEISSTTSSIGYKGKVLRSWSQLPAEVIRLIATHYLLDFRTFAYVPTTWEAREMWPRRIVYTVMRDAPEVEKLMSICPSWGSALESHAFWQHACAAIDPNDMFAQHRFIQTTAPTTAGSNATASVMRISHHKHFRNLYRYTCIVCRINYPFHNTGLAAAKRLAHTAWLGTIPVCREHRKASFCGLCLREAPALELESEYSYVCCVENDDDETWPGIDATCRSCRTETLWRVAGREPGDREALGGPSFESPDWETRQAVESFIEMGEGTIGDILNTAREKFWMRGNTKLADMLMQALAANRYASRAEAGETGYGSDDDMSDEEDDIELLSLTEDSGGVKDLAMMDWARSRILDGYWINPADHYYNYILPGKAWVPTEHPCPWNKGATFCGALEDGETELVGEELPHPRPKTISAPQPPTFSLSENAYRAYARAMRDVLLPAMNNLVRKIVIESTADGVDPAMRAGRMTLEEVVSELRDEAMWFNGIDWLERRANRAREEHETIRAARRRPSEEDDCSSSSRSDGSHTTSPVLSTTTLQTTPSPPPSADSSSKEEEGGIASPGTASAPAIPIPVAPVLKSPQLIHPIPYIPITISHLPQYSYESVWMVWREAMSPLFQCRCSICERTMLKLNIANGNIVPSQATNDVSKPAPTAPAAPQEPTQPPQKPVEVQLDEAETHLMKDSFENPDDCGDDLNLTLPQTQYRVPYRAQTPARELSKAAEARRDGIGGKRLRPALAEEEEEDDDSIIDFISESEDELQTSPTENAYAEADCESNNRTEREGSPPKRARVDGTYSPARAPTPTRLRKRSSEELEDSDDDGRMASPMGNGDAKRQRSSTERLDGIRALKAEARVRS